MQELKRKVKGALLGIAYGDSFGMPTEMWTPEQIRERVGRITDFQKGFLSFGFDSVNFEFDFLADHHFGKLLLVCFGSVYRGYILAFTKYGYSVRNRHNLVKLVRNYDYRFSVVLHRS